MSRKEDAKALDVLRSIRLQEGNRQIAMVQEANCLARLRDHPAAIDAYRAAADAEKRWGQRKKSTDSDYILGYCALYETILTRWMGGASQSDVMSLYDELLSLDVTPELKNRLLVLPNRSELVSR
ncbi:hypothetical protein ACOXXX_20225 [Thalassococcus sp. BH17M4-6]|uniref:hypothetical protein n=1 Tax=Thalassococcus sp. BH17M4-6 TaxID=3413148 RepID=UPI003BCEC92F